MEYTIKDRTLLMQYTVEAPSKENAVIKHLDEHYKSCWKQLDSTGWYINQVERNVHIQIEEVAKSWFIESKNFRYRATNFPASTPDQAISDLLATKEDLVELISTRLDLNEPVTLTVTQMGKCNPIAEYTFRKFGGEIFVFEKKLNEEN
jgi:hypothetical protein